jgi:phosphoserine phosphatase RsbX
MSAVLDVGDHTLIAAIDGLGHGPDAAAAAQVAAQTIAGYAEEPLEGLMRRCHDAMTHTRGAAITLAAVFDDGRIDWLAVGNVDAIILRGGRSTTGSVDAVYHFPGVVGSQIPPVHALTSHVVRGDVLTMTTDGIDARYLTTIEPIGPAEVAAQRILLAHARDNDDALVVVARVR